MTRQTARARTGSRKKRPRSLSTHPLRDLDPAHHAALHSPTATLLGFAWHHRSAMIVSLVLLAASVLLFGLAQLPSLQPDAATCCHADALTRLATRAEIIASHGRCDGKLTDVGRVHPGRDHGKCTRRATTVLALEGAGAALALATMAVNVIGRFSVVRIESKRFLDGVFAEHPKASVNRDVFERAVRPRARVYARTAWLHLPWDLLFFLLVLVHTEHRWTSAFWWARIVLLTWVSLRFIGGTLVVTHKGRHGAASSALHVAEQVVALFAWGLLAWFFGWSLPVYRYFWCCPEPGDGRSCKGRRGPCPSPWHKHSTDFWANLSLPMLMAALTLLVLLSLRIARVVRAKERIMTLTLAAWDDARKAGVLARVTRKKQQHGQTEMSRV